MSVTLESTFGQMAKAASWRRICDSETVTAGVFVQHCTFDCLLSWSCRVLRGLFLMASVGNISVSIFFFLDLPVCLFQQMDFYIRYIHYCAV